MNTYWRGVQWRKSKRETWRFYFFRILFKAEFDTLCWYADRHHWQAIHAKENMTIANVDFGQRARDVLGDDE